MATVLDASITLVPSDTKLNTKYRAVVVPVVSVPVVLNPVPNVITKLLVPLVRTISWHVVPAGGTVVV